MPDTYLTPAVMDAVGKTSSVRSGVVSATDIRKFCVAIDDANPLYLDPEAARALGHADVIAPPLFNAAATRAVPLRSGLLADGQFDDVAPSGMGQLQTMLAGQSWEMLRPTVAGERITETVETKSITERQGSTGPIVFVEHEAVFSTSAGEVLGRSTNTLILRQAPPPRAGPSPTALRAVEPGDHPTTVITQDGMTKRPDMVSLFMFSAAIWAVHRIHWDAPYAQQEGLPLPVLPGWMLSSYLAQLAQMRAPAGHELSRIAIRYKSPVHPGDRLDCKATPKDDGTSMVLSMRNQAGVEVASGDAGYSG